MPEPEEDELVLLDDELVDDDDSEDDEPEEDDPDVFEAARLSVR